MCFTLVFYSVFLINLTIV